MLKTSQKIKILSINIPQKSRGNEKKNDLPLEEYIAAVHQIIILFPLLQR